MCGFAGFVSFQRSMVDAVQRRRILQAMGDAMARRGPDDTQYFDDGTLALVYRRLSIIDVEGGRQPFFNEVGDQVLVANGEVYNHHELRSALLGAHTFASRSDCEPLLHGFEQWGLGVLARARGMYALAHWDLRRRVLTLARDRLGIKPLYLCRTDDGLLFGSELKALLAHPACPREIAWEDVDRAAIAQPYAASYVRGVELLAGGQVMVVDAGMTAQPTSYWSLHDHLGAAPFGDKASDYVDAYVALLQESVAQHLQRDVGAAVQLSGGVDSSLLAAIVARHDREIPCVTVVERTSYVAGDVGAAQRLTARLGLPWMPVRFDHRSVLRDMRLDLRRIEEAVWMMDSPRLELEWLFKEELHRAARARMASLKVVLLGQGADEFAGGYSRRQDAPYADWAAYLKQEVEPNLVFAKAREGQASVHRWQMGLAGSATHAAESPFHRFMRLTTHQLQHHNLWHEDRTSSWQSLEARVPFLDHRLVELLASVPEQLHEALFWDKQIVRAALDRVLPEHAITQAKLAFLDGGESLDVIHHDLLQTVADDFRQKYLSGNDGPFDRAKVSQAIDDALSRGPRRASAMRDALDVMAITIFAQQLKSPFAAVDDARPALRLMSDADWAHWAQHMRQPPHCTHAWQSDDVVALAEGVEMAVPFRDPGKRVRFYRQGVFAGEITIDASAPWVASFLRNNGTPAAEDFRIQDWLDEFDLTLAAFTPVLDVLLHMGVVRPGRRTPDAAGAGAAGASPRAGQAQAPR